MRRIIQTPSRKIERLQSIAAREQYLKDQLDRFKSDTADFETDKFIYILREKWDGPLGCTVNLIAVSMLSGARIQIRSGDIVRLKYYDLEMIVRGLYLVNRVHTEMCSIPEDMLTNPERFGTDKWVLLDKDKPACVWFGGRNGGLAEAIKMDLEYTRRLCVFTEKIPYVMVQSIADEGIVRYLPVASLQIKSER